jgi:SanA protein
VSENNAAKASVPRVNRRRRCWRRLFWGALLGSAIFLAGADWAVRRAAAGRVYDCADGMPPADVALVLGSSRTLADGRANWFYTARLDVAAELFRLGKVRGLIVSGDNSRSDYSEPDDMKTDLVARGVPERFITCDYAGLRTLDSVQRISRVFGQRRVIVVSQREHVERAIFLAQADGIEMTGCVAASAPRWWQVRQRLREVLARGAAVLDVALGRGPKYLGTRETVPLAGAD